MPKRPVPEPAVEVTSPSGRFRPGQSGNPRGRPPADPTARAIAQLVLQAYAAGGTITISFAPPPDIAVKVKR